MILNDKTIKKGVILYCVTVVLNKDYDKYWNFTIQKVKVTDVIDYCGYVAVGYLSHGQTNTNDIFHVDVPCCNGMPQGRFVSNNKQHLVLREEKDRYGNEWLWFCDSYESAINILKKTIFNGKGNEATKRYRLKLYRKFVESWIKIPYKENLSIRINYEL